MLDSWCSGSIASFGKKSVIPGAFWYLSVAGGSIILCYAIHRREPVFFIGESVTLLVFLRNLHLLKRGLHGGDLSRGKQVVKRIQESDHPRQRYP
ncbi:lipid-A-disaccharide synthase N-terminal domain-containing protein [Dyella sp. Tek66A03]|uniref:lipid-A-disaccharide synthase N-terminal domain-containing protein n=1 Tax=Dyella sp. Tek66A03 TaxID=3458298 RepID=UPI00403EEDB3